MKMIAKKFTAAALIDGQWITSNKTFSVSDPATGAEVATVPDLRAKDAARPIDAATRARRAPPHRRRQPRAACLVGQDRKGGGVYPQALVRSHHRRDREPRPADDDRA